jgi:uncharacterized protein YhfF
MNRQRSNEDRKAAANLLRAVLEGSISATAALEQWPSAVDDEVIERIRCLLYHFRDDDDIRIRDRRYAEWQYNEFRMLLKQLEGEGAH